MVNQIRLSICAGIAARKLSNAPAAIFSDTCRSRWFIFTEQINVLFPVIFYSYLQSFLKIGRHFTQSTGKQLCRSVFLMSQQAATFLIKNSDIDAFLWMLRNCQEHLDTPDSVFMEHICNYNIIKFKVSQPKWLFQPFETLINIEMYTCGIKIT